MNVTKDDVQAAVTRLMKHKRAVVKLREMAKSRRDIERLNQMMERIQIMEKERVEYLRSLKKGR
jgi:uncharacterized protein YegL